MNVSTAELKNYLHKLVVETDDEIVLSKVQAYFTKLRSKNTDWWDTISDEDKETIHIGLRQLEKGQGIPHDQVRQKVNKLLRRE